MIIVSQVAVAVLNQIMNTSQCVCAAWKPNTARGAKAGSAWVARVTAIQARIASFTGRAIRDSSLSEP